MQKIMMDFERESEMMGMKEELMDDAMGGCERIILPRPNHTNNPTTNQSSPVAMIHTLITI
jgi:hypothetical protein